jgi:hydrogenase nickel incorporation protein HypA/HybF
VEEEARARGAVAVHALSVRIGELAGVDPELFQTAYDTFRAGTRCADTPLLVTRVPARWSCPTCLAPIPAGAALRCATCDLPARLDDGSDALLLERIELEVP